MVKLGVSNIILVNIFLEYSINELFHLGGNLVFLKPVLKQRKKARKLLLNRTKRNACNSMQPARLTRKKKISNFLIENAETNISHSRIKLVIVLFLFHIQAFLYKCHDFHQFHAVTSLNIYSIEFHAAIPRF